MEGERKIVLAGTHNLGNEGIIAALERESNFQSSYEIWEPETLLSKLGEVRGIDIPDMVIIPPDLIGEDNETIISQIKTSAPSLKILIISDPHSKTNLIKDMRLGVEGYVLSNISTDELIFAIKHILSGNFYISTSLYSDLIRMLTQSENNGTAASIELTQREEQLLQLILEGYSNQEIAYQLFTNKNTILKYRKNLLERTGAPTMASLLRQYMAVGAGF